MTAEWDLCGEHFLCDPGKLQYHKRKQASSTVLSQESIINGLGHVTEMRKELEKLTPEVIQVAGWLVR